MGWDAGSPYYDLPYTADEVNDLDRFDYERLGSWSASRRSLLCLTCAPPIPRSAGWPH